MHVGAYRRIYPRLNPDALSVAASITIPNRPAVTLVDLSQGGARMDLPFQMSPDARVTPGISRSAGAHDAAVPAAAMLRRVAERRGGVSSGRHLRQRARLEAA